MTAVLTSTGDAEPVASPLAPAVRRSKATPPSPGTGSQHWPESPLDAAGRAFDLLTLPPAPLAFDCRAIPGLPPAIVDLAELKSMLLAHRPPPAPTIDLVWRELVIRSRRDGPAWVLAATGVALPGLRRRAGLFASTWTGERADLDSELLLGFLERLAVLDIEAPHICARLIDAAAKTIRRSPRHSEVITIPPVNHPASGPPPRPWDHPDLVLDRAVRAAVISSEDAALISSTRLGDTTVADVADLLDRSVAAVLSARRRAERDLVEAIHAGELR